MHALLPFIRLVRLTAVQSVSFNAMVCCNVFESSGVVFFGFIVRSFHLDFRTLVGAVPRVDAC